MFHARDGQFFERQDDGSVRILSRETGHGGAAILKDVTLGPSEWASVVASMSLEGEDGETWRLALRAQVGSEGARALNLGAEISGVR